MDQESREVLLKYISVSSKHNWRRHIIIYFTKA